MARPCRMGPEGAFRDPMATPALIDSHCYIVFRNFEEDLDEVAARWREAGVQSLLHACVEPGEIPAIRALADQFPENALLGGECIPGYRALREDTPEVLRQAAQADGRVVAIGELGLDLFRDKNLDEQLAVLRPQLDLAVELDLPVIVHCRDAADPMLKELRRRQEQGCCLGCDALLGWDTRGDASIFGAGFLHQFQWHRDLPQGHANT